LNLMWWAFSETEALSSAPDSDDPRLPLLPHAADEDGGDGAHDFPAFEGAVRAGGEEFVGVDEPLGFGVEEHNVGRSTDGERAGGEVEDARGARGHQVDEARQGDDARFDEFVIEDGEGGFKPGKAEGGVVEFDLLFLKAVGCVVGRDAVDGAVHKRFAQGLDVVFRTKRRLHLETRVETLEARVVEHQVMWGHIGGN